MVRRVSSAVLLVAMGLTGTSGCGAADPRVIESDSGMRVLVAAQTDDAMEALASGVLALGVGGCLYLSDGSEPGDLIVWPHGTTAVRGEDAVRVPGKGVYKVGDDLDLTGGSVALPAAVLPQIPTACAVGAVFLVAAS
jgi:hypothetical protein